MPTEKRTPEKRTSAKQREANRANAKKSTGPRSQESKNIVRYNNLKHGLTGQAVLLPGEDRAAYEESRLAMIAAYAPANTRELNLAVSIADDYWRLNRARLYEQKILAAGHADPGFTSDPEIDPDLQHALAEARTFRDHIGEFVRLSLYEQRIQRSIHRNNILLKQLQMARKPINNPTPINGLPAKSAKNGFGFANNVFERWG